MGRRLKYSVPQLHALWAAGLPVREIAAALGLPETTVSTLRARHKLPIRKRKYAPPVRTDPTPDEIRARARECRRKHFAQRRAEKVDHYRTVGA